MKTYRNMNISVVVLVTLLATGCASTVIGTATDTVLAAAKVPFKAGGAIVDVLDGDDD